MLNVRSFFCLLRFFDKYSLFIVAHWVIGSYLPYEFFFFQTSHLTAEGHQLSINSSGSSTYAICKVLKILDICLKKPNLKTNCFLSHLITDSVSVRRNLDNVLELCGVKFSH